MEAISPGRRRDHRRAAQRRRRRPARRTRPRLRRRTRPATSPAPPAPPAPPMLGEDDEEGGLARITLRIPESVKTKAEDAAARSGQSLNTWLVNVVRAATRDGAINVDIDLSSIPFFGSDPFGGRQAARQPPHDRLGLTDPHHHPPTLEGRPGIQAGPADEHTQETVMSSYEFETHEPVDLYVELGKGERRRHRHRHHRHHRRGRGPRRRARRGPSGRPPDQRDRPQGQPRRRSSAASRRYAVTISLPTHSNVVVKTGSADVAFDGTFGHGQVKSGSGDCRLDTLRRPADRRDRLRRHRARPGPAPSSASRAAPATSTWPTPRAPSSVSTGSGDVEIGTTNGQAVVKTGSGDLEIGRAGDDVSMSTGSGDMKIGAATAGKFNAKGASGDVMIGVPAGDPGLDRHDHRQRLDPLRPAAAPASPSRAPTTSSCGPRPSAATSSSAKSDPPPTPSPHSKGAPP